MSTRQAVYGTIKLFVILIAVTLVIFVGCADIPKTPPPPIKYPPEVPQRNYQFSYTPLKESSSVKATIGLISPVVTIRTTTGGTDLKMTFKEDLDLKFIQDAYTKAFESDINATLIAKGDGVTGPYASLDIMTFGEKDAVNVVLVPTFILEVKFSNGEKTLFYDSDRVRTDKTVGTSRVYKRDNIFEIPGTIVAGGFIELTAYEPLSKQKLWVKKIEVPFEQVSYKFYVFQNWEYHFQTIKDAFDGLATTVSLSREAFTKYDGRLEKLGSMLEKAYAAQLEQFSRYFSPKEMAHVFEDAKKARERARFSQ